MARETANCVFCDIVAGRAPAHRVGENARALAILDISPFSPGHTLVMSKRHVPFWHDLTAGEAADVFALAHRVARKLKAAFEPEFVCLMARGRRIAHARLPRADGSGRRSRPPLQPAGNSPGNFGGARAAAGARVPRGRGANAAGGRIA